MLLLEHYGLTVTAIPQRASMASHRASYAGRGVFYTPGKPRPLVEGWRQTYKQLRPHSSLGYRPPASPATMPAPAQPATSQPTTSRKKDHTTAPT